MTSAEEIHCWAHTMAGAVARGEPVSENDRSHLEAAWTYLGLMLGPHTQVQQDVLLVYKYWQRMGTGSVLDPKDAA